MLLRVRLPFLTVPILCCFNPFTYYESEVFEHQYEISFLPLSVFLDNCWLSKGICACPCAFCLTLDACTAKWLCSCRHFCVCVQIFRDPPPPPPPIFVFVCRYLETPPPPPPPHSFLCSCADIQRHPPPPPISLLFLLHCCILLHLYH